jgi:hypothetical protein
VARRNLIELQCSKDLNLVYKGNVPQRERDALNNG